MVMWLMSEAKGMERSLDGLASGCLLVNFASIHTHTAICVCDSFSKYLDVRRSRKRCTAFLPIQNTSYPSVKKSKPSWPRKPGRKLDWTKCTRSTVSCERLNGQTV